MPNGAWFVPIYIAARLVPPSRRAEWRRGWLSNLASWRVLVDRGELPPRSATVFFRRALADASRERFGVLRPYRFLAGPWFPVAIAVLAMTVLGLATHGFSTARHVVALVNDMRLHPHTNYRYDWRGDRVFGYLCPIVIAASIGMALLFLKRRSLESLGWRLWSLLLFEVISLHLLGSLLWIEGGHALFSYMAREGFSFGLPAIFLAVTFVIGFGFAALWSMADQRRRCPICLHRLVMPVALGSWASVFDPAATELVCSEGHGSLALIEVDAEAAAPDKWTELDASWQYLFPKDKE